MVPFFGEESHEIASTREVSEEANTREAYAVVGSNMTRTSFFFNNSPSDFTLQQRRGVCCSVEAGTRLRGSYLTICLHD